ncbi:MAG: hypothetical protein ABJC13_08430 [Acidobacteriota bacterium]
MTIPTKRLFVLLPLTLLLALPAGAMPRGDSPSILARLSGFLSALWAEGGCMIDPNGGCTTAPIVSDEGCMIDPNGRCKDSSIVRDEGCMLDPNGRCRQ